jgi:hypothetical protein
LTAKDPISGRKKGRCRKTESSWPKPATGPFDFHSPADEQGLDRAGYFERCWPGAGTLTEFEFVRLIEDGDEVVVTYEATREDGSRFRNTEVLGFDGDKQVSAEVYFGWNL